MDTAGRARPEAEEAGVYASRWELDGVTLWTLVHRGETDHDGPLLPDGTPGRVPAAASPRCCTWPTVRPEPAWLPHLRDVVATLDETAPHDPDARFPHRLARRLAPAAETVAAPGAGVVPGRAPSSSPRGRTC